MKKVVTLLITVTEGPWNPAEGTQNQISAHSVMFDNEVPPNYWIDGVVIGGITPTDAVRKALEPLIPAIIMHYRDTEGHFGE